MDSKNILTILKKALTTFMCFWLLTTEMPINVVLAEVGEDIASEGETEVVNNGEEDDSTGELTEEQIEEEGQYTVNEDGELVEVDEENNEENQEPQELGEDEVVIDEAIVKINNRYYGSLQDALKHYSDNEEITLLADLDVDELNEDVTFNTNDFVLNTNLFTVNSKSTVALDSNNNLSVKGSLTFKNNISVGTNGTYNYVSSTNAINIVDGKKITLEDDGIINTNSISGNVIAKDEDKFVVKAGNTVEAINSLDEVFNKYTDNTLIVLLQDAKLHSDNAYELTKIFEINLNGKTLDIENNDRNRLYINDVTLSINGTKNDSKLLGSLYVGSKDGNNSGSLIINGGNYIGKDNNSYGLPAIETNKKENNLIEAKDASFIGGNKQLVLDQIESLIDDDDNNNINKNRNTESSAIVLNSNSSYSFDSCTFDGATGIYVKGGALSLNDCEVNAYGNSYSAKLNNNNVDSTGDAIV